MKNDKYVKISEELLWCIEMLNRNIIESMKAQEAKDKDWYLEAGLEIANRSLKRVIEMQNDPSEVKVFNVSLEELDNKLSN